MLGMQLPTEDSNVLHKIRVHRQVGRLVALRSSNYLNVFTILFLRRAEKTLDNCRKIGTQVLQLCRCRNDCIARHRGLGRVDRVEKRNETERKSKSSIFRARLMKRLPTRLSHFSD